jgi:DNA primase
MSGNESHEVELRVAELPHGSDPAELARTDPAALRGAIERAQPFLGFRVERALAQADLSTPEGRARAAKAALEAVAEHPNPLVRDQYLLSIGDRTHHEVEQLRTLLETERVAFANAEVKAPARPATPEPPAYDEPPDDATIPGPERQSREAPAPGERRPTCASAAQDATRSRSVFTAQMKRRSGFAS